MAERRVPDAARQLLALQAAHEAVALRLRALATVPGVMRTLRTLAAWPVATVFDPLQALNAPAQARSDTGDARALQSPRGARPQPMSALRERASSQAARIRADANPPVTRPAAEHVTPHAPLGQATREQVPLQLTPAAHAETATQAPGATIARSAQSAAVIEALLQRSVPGRGLPRWPAIGHAGGAPPRLPTHVAAAQTMDALLAPAMRPGFGRKRPDMGPKSAGAAPIGLGVATPTLQRVPNLSPRDPIGDAMSSLLPAATAVAAADAPVAPLAAPRAAPRAASRLLPPEPAAATAAVPADSAVPPASDSADDGRELLGTITRSLIDQAWLRGVNLG